MGQKTDKKPIWKDWRFWVGVVIVLAIVGVVYSNKGRNQNISDNNSSQQNVTETASMKDYSGQDAKDAYSEITSLGYSIKFVFDRNNNGGFSEDDFQKFVTNSFTSEYYNDSPFIVTKQDSEGKNVTLYIEYGSVVNGEKEQADKEAKLEEKLSIVSAMTACEQYGENNYRHFKMHSITGKISESAFDENTWFLKYYVDADGYKNKNMECYVTGTTDNPQVSNFLIY